jgi:hypothetical protein
MKRASPSKAKLNGQTKPARTRRRRVKEEAIGAPRQRRLVDEIIEGDALQELKRFPANSVDLIVTSPPMRTAESAPMAEFTLTNTSVGLRQFHLSFIER